MNSFTHHTFGCRVNQAETEKIARELIAKGFTFNPEKYRLFIINTCAVTAKAEREARQLINKVKRENPKAKIILTGCAATKWLKENKKLPQIDLMIDNAQKENLAKIIARKFLQNKIIPFLPRETEKPINKYEKSKRVIVKIQDGCQRFCTYCIVAYLRGRPKSVRIKDIVKYIKKIEKHYTEVILTAINTEGFGLDTGESFTDLMQSILNNTAIQRLSFGSINPWSINDEFFLFYEKNKDNPRLVHFFHIPLQSGSDKILSLMKRGYKADDMIKKFNKIKSLNPFAFIATDIITGFPGENDKDFQDTCRFLKESPVSKLHVFRFSKRENTAAFFMAKNYPENDANEIETRSKTLIKHSHEKYLAFQKKHHGRKFSALVLEKTQNGRQEILLSNQMPALLQDDTRKTASKTGSILWVTTNFTNGTILGRS